MILFLFYEFSDIIASSRVLLGFYLDKK